MSTANNNNDQVGERKRRRVQETSLSWKEENRNVPYLRSMTKQRLINIVLSLENARRGAWSTYYETVLRCFELFYPKLAKNKRSPEAECSFLKGIAIQYQQNGGRFKCAICLEEYETSQSQMEETKEKLMLLGCGHLYCKTCINNKSIHECPLCREKINKIG